MEFVVFGMAIVLFLLAGALLGILAFVKARRLERELAGLRDLVSAKLAPAGAASSPGQRPERATDLPEISAPPQIDAPTEESADPAPTKKPGPDGPKTPPPKKPGRSLEETIGSYWAVWVGGLALMLGAVFLVRYTIEAGLLGPGTRIALGLVFSAVLAGAGEWTRRRAAKFSFAGFERANIPAILTAAGTMGAFATIFAAYQLYDMLPDPAAFAALGLVAVATTIAALLHGPLLAVLGILASYVSPFLIASDTPSIIGLGAYVLAVSAAGFGVGRLRLWQWLAVSCAGGLIFFGAVLHMLATDTDRLAVVVYLAAAFAMVGYVFVGSLYARNGAFEKLDRVASGLLIALTVLFLGALIGQRADIFTASVLALVIAVPFAMAIYYPAVRALVYGAMGVAAIGYFGWSVPANELAGATGAELAEYLRANFRVRVGLSLFIGVGFTVAALAAAMGLYGVFRSPSRVAMAIGGAFTPVLFLAAAYGRIEVFSNSILFAALALGLAAASAGLSHLVYVRLGEAVKGRDGASAAYMVAAFGALGLAMTIIGEKGALTVALALLSPAIAFVYWRRPLPGMRALAVLAAVLWVGRIIWDPRIAGADLGTVPVFNWLTYGYGIPTLGFALAAWLLGTKGRDRWVEALEAITLASFVATLGLVGLHALLPQQVFTAINTLEEAAVLSMVGGGVALGLLRMGRTRQSAALTWGATVLGYGGLFGSAVGLLVVFNPWLTGVPFGQGLIWNGLFLAYLAPAAIYFALGCFSTGKRPPLYSNAALALGALLAATWINLSIRHGFHPVRLTLGPTTDAELYTYSVVWLIIGVSAMAAGIFMGSRVLRIASVVILGLVAAKVFLIDMAGLEGILRAVSFIGLGATLVGIGLVYQRVLSSGGARPAAKKSDQEPQNG